MDNLEEVLQCLNEFHQTAEKTLTPELEQLLEHIAKTGRTIFPWQLLKPLISFKLEKVLNDFFETTSTSNACISDPTTKSQEFIPAVEKLISNLNCFSGTPFTIQRLCELITQPRKHYKTTDKFLRGVEKNIMVVSTVQTDGSLITRSLSPVLTNGAVSPTESVPVKMTLNTPNNPSHNSPLNTNFQENGANTNTSSSAVPAEEKQQTLSTEDCKVDSNSHEVNGTQNKDAVEDQFVEEKNLECAQNGQHEKDVVSEEKEISHLTPASDNLQENVEICKEKKLTAVEKPSEEENEERPAAETLQDENEEKMDES